MTPVIEGIRITKRYGKLVAVDDLDLAVPLGACFGLLGPNGAGKTTLVEIIEDIIRPTSGHIRYQGRPRTKDFREQIGIMFQQTALLAFMTVQETLAIFQSLYSDGPRIRDLVELCQLDDIRDRQNDKISGGQRQRLLMALALINRPELVFLDEPSTGLDPQARRNLWDIVEGIKREGKTVILTTHYMEEAQQLCDQVAIMDRGKIIAQGSPGELINQHGGGTNMLLPKECLKRDKINLPFEHSETETHVHIRIEDMNRAVDALLEAGVDLSHMEVRTPNLEAVFLNLTGRLLRE